MTTKSKRLRVICRCNRLGTEMKVLVDDPEQSNPFEVAYCECNIVSYAIHFFVVPFLLIWLLYIISAPCPIRLYVIENGMMRFISAPTDCAHDVSELRAWLEKRHGSK